MIPGGVAMSNSALVGEALGQQDTKRAMQVLPRACGLAVLLVVAYAVPVVFERDQIGELLGGGVPVVESTVAAVLPLLMIMHECDGLFNVLKSWLTVRNEQYFGALMSLVVYYCLGLPFGFFLAFHAGLGLIGLWLGLGSAVFLGTIATFLQ